MAAPSYVAAGTAQLVTTAAAMPYPAGLAAGDLIILTVSNTASGIGNASGTWTELGTATTGGSMTTRRWWKIATGSESGTETINVTSGVKGIGYMTAYRPATSGNTLTPSLTTGADSSSDTTFTPTGSSWTSATDNLVAVEVIALAATTFSAIGSSLALSQSGATYGAINNRFAARASSNTLWYAHSDAAVTSGGTGAPAFSATLNGAGTGQVVYIKVVESAPAGATVNAVAATATAAANAPVWRGGGKVTGVAATASALVKPPPGPARVNAVVATASALSTPPAVSNGSNQPQFVASFGAQGGSTVNNLTATTPATVVAGNIGYIVSFAGGGTGAATAPAGWGTLVNDQSTSGGSSRFSIFYRTYVAGDADPNVSWPSAPASGNNTCILAFWYTGGGTPTVGSISTSATANTVWTAPSLTTTSANHTIVALSGEKGGGTGWGSIATWSPDATMRASRYGTGNFYPSVVLGDFSQASAGATNAQSATWNYSTANAWAVELDLPPGGVSASVSAVAATATASARTPGTGSQINEFPPAGTGSALVKVPVIFAASGVSGGGPMVATAFIWAPGVRQRITVNARATATAAGIAPQPLGSSNIVVVATATASAVTPLSVSGSALVTAVVATSTATTGVPTLSNHAAAVVAAATAAMLAPRIGQSTVRPLAASALAAMPTPVVGGVVVATVATATAGVIEPVVLSNAVIIVGHLAASGIVIDPVVGHTEWVFRTPINRLHYRTGDPLMDRIGYPTGTSVLLIDGFYINVEYPDDEQIQAATKVYLGGRDYILTSDEVVSLTSAGYGEFINQEVFA